MKRSLIIVISFILLSSFLTACGAGSSKSLSGIYVANTDNCDFDYIEFFSDGKYTSSHSNYEGNYSIDGNRIRLEGILVDSRIYYFKASGNTLELSYYKDFENPDIYKKSKIKK